MEEFVDVTRGGKTARVWAGDRDAIAAALFGDATLDPCFLGGRGQVYRFHTALGPGILRPYRRGGFVRHFIKDRYWRVNRARRELDVLRQLYDAGLPVPRPLGAMWEAHGSFYSGSMATLEIPGKSLLVYLRDQPDDREAVLRECGRAILRLHDFGLIHADLQVENIFVGENGVFILDFDKARIVEHVSDSQRTANLLRLYRSIMKVLLDPRDFEAVRNEYAARSAIHNANSTTEHGFEIPDKKYYECALNVDPDHIMRLIADPGVLLKTPNRWSTRRVQDVVIKEYRANSRTAYLGQLDDPQRFRRAWEATAFLRARGVGVPEALAHVEQRAGGFVSYSALVTRMLDGYVNVEARARSLNATEPRERHEAFLAGLAASINTLARTGAYHADLSGKNILVNAADHFVFVDLDSVRLHTPYSDEKRLKNHVQLYDSFCDVWDDALLRPFIARMLPGSYDAESWFVRVKTGQRERRARHEARWRR